MTRAAIALTANTAINAGLGFLFWVAAARLYDPATVGLASAGISALLLTGGVGWFGLQYVLIRYLPDAGHRQWRLIASCYVAASLIAGPAAVVLLASPAGAAIPFLRDPAGAIILGVSAVAWAVFSLQDAALIGLRRTVIVPLENGIFGVAKLLALLPLATIGGPAVIFLAWAVSAGVLAGLMNLLVLRPLAGRARGPARLPATGSLARFAAGQHLGALVAALPDWLIPLVVVILVGEADNAMYYAAWTIAFALRLVTVNLANVYTVEAVSTGSAGRELRRLAPLAITPLVLGGLLFADPLLAVFGPEYVAAAPVLRLFSLGLIPFSIVMFRLAVARVQHRSGPIVIVGAITTTVWMGITIVLLPQQGIVAAGTGWLAAQVLGAAAAIMLTGRLHGPRQGVAAA